MRHDQYLLWLVAFIAGAGIVHINRFVHSNEHVHENTQKLVVEGQFGRDEHAKFADAWGIKNNALAPAQVPARAPALTPAQQTSNDNKNVLMAAVNPPEQ